jgi:hypothetical protein
VKIYILLLLGGLRPNTVILGFYDNTAPEDKLRTRPFSKKRWVKASIPVNTSATVTLQPQPTIRSGGMEGASTITLNSFNSSATINGNDMDPIFNFRGKMFFFVII